MSSYGLSHDDATVGAFLAACAPATLGTDLWGPRMTCWAGVISSHLADFASTSGQIRIVAAGVQAYGLGVQASYPQVAADAAALAQSMLDAASVVDSEVSKWQTVANAMQATGQTFTPADPTDPAATALNDQASATAVVPALHLVDNFMTQLDRLQDMRTLAQQVSVQQGADFATTRQLLLSTLEALKQATASSSVLEDIINFLFGSPAKLALSVLVVAGTVLGGVYLYRKAKGR
jgi:hypothetical protein